MRDVPRLNWTAGLTAGLALLLCQSAFATPPPVGRAPGEARDNRAWWPNQVDLGPLRHDQRANPYGADFDYAKAFSKLDLAAVKKDIAAVLTDSQPWWPADYGNYGPFFIRMAWHSAGTYRVIDGRGGAGGGQQRFEPLNSWPDNGNLDKARRLVWPVKQKYGRALSWADLMVLAGNVAMEQMGFKTLGFAGGRADDWQADNTYWGPEAKMLADQRHNKDGSLQRPLGASQMGLIYVNPQGPGGNPDPKLAAKEIRRTFGLMAMNDEETVALIAGGHSFGKAHGAHSPDKCVGAEPAGQGVEAQGTGWHNTCGKGHSEDTVTSGLEGAWTSTPAQWSHQFFGNLMGFKWAKTKSPAGATQWAPTDSNAKEMVPDAHVKGKRHAPMMLTTDLSLREDPAYAKISKRFTDDPKAFELAFAKAWFKLTHRDLGPRARYLGAEVPKEVFAWQDPLDAVDGPKLSPGEIKRIKKAILDSGATIPQLVRTAWSSASSFRGTDMRGGANGARVRLAPQNTWAANSPNELKGVLAKLEGVKKKFDAVSMADVIVLGGAAAIEAAAKAGGHTIEIPFTSGRADATAAQTDAQSFSFLEPVADGFRNYYTAKALRRPSDALIDKASMLNLTVPEMTALVGGLRALDANTGGSKTGVLTTTPGTLNNAFFRTLLDLSTTWKPKGKNQFVGTSANGKTWTASEVDLLFGSNAELRAIAEVYASEEDVFLKDFVSAWVKVMQADRFDLHR